MRLPRAAKKGHKFFTKTTILASFLLSLIIMPNTLALDESILRMFSLNNILGYDDDCTDGNSSFSSSSFTLGNYDGIPTAGLTSEQSEFVDQYHDMVVAYSVEYGIPWEMAIAQGINESATGTSALALNKYNFHGINAVDEKTCGYSGCTYDVAFAYATPSDGWYGYFYNMGNSNYHRDPFLYPTDPLDALTALQTPNDATNNKKWASSPTYVEDVGSLVKAVQQRAAEKGWDSSADIAQKYPQYLENAKKYSIGTKPDITVINKGSGNPSNPISFPDKPTGLAGVTGGSTSATSTYSWKNGWLQDFEGIIKDSATSFVKNNSAAAGKHLDSSYTSDYTTKLNGKVGPNKITLHSTESGNAKLTNDSAMKLYIPEKPEVTVMTPPHFTIDLKNRKIYQHFSINSPSTAITDYDTDAGIQIEIVGYSDEQLKNEAEYEPDYYLYGDGNFSDDDWAYLTDFLYAISGETGIPIISPNINWNAVDRLSPSAFKTFSGVLGHQHTPSPNTHTDPGNVWEKISSSSGGGRNSNGQSSSSSSSGSYNSLCNNGLSSENNSLSTKGGEGIAQLAVSAAWPYRTGEDGKEGFCANDELFVKYGVSCTTPPKPKYEELFKQAGITGSYQDCGHFVASIIIGGGFDPNFKPSGSGAMLTYLQGATDLWEEVENKGDDSNLQPGDIIARDGHIEIYVGEYGGTYGKIASASKAGENASATVGAIKVNENNLSKFQIFRYKGGGSINLESGGFTLEEARKFIAPYREEACKKPPVNQDFIFDGASVNKYGNAQGTLNNCTAYTQWFLNKFTSAGPSGAKLSMGNKAAASYLGKDPKRLGYKIAGMKGDANGNPSHTPALFAVMSHVAPANHTGIVLGIDASRNQIIIGEASYNNGCNSKYPNANEYKLSELSTSEYEYAYTDDIIDLAKINSYYESLK